MRFYDKNASFPQTLSGELGDVEDGGRLRFLQGKVDTTLSCVCVCVHVYTVGSV